MAMNNNTVPTLPVRGIEQIDLNGYLLLNCPQGLGLGDVLNSLEMWIMTIWAAGKRRECERLMETGKYHWTDDELDEIEHDECVISPITLWAYSSDRTRLEIGWDRKKPWERERYVLDLYPGRFSARYSQNRGYVNARKERPIDELDEDEIRKYGELERRNEEEIKRFVEEECHDSRIRISMADAIRNLINMDPEHPDETCGKITEWHNVNSKI